MATIYEGTEISNDRHVAIKFLRSEIARVPEMLDLFQAEAQALSKLNHPNVVRGLAAGSFSGARYIVMEFVTGPTLRERLRWGRPEKDEALSILRQAAAGLDHAHDRGVIHRDIKPDNFILEKNVVRLTDFGIAQIDSVKAPKGESTAMGGTVIYSAPEQFAEGGAVDRRTDVYSLGVVAYEVFTGKTPFAGYKPASSLNHQVPRAADAVLERAFHENRDERYPTAGTFFRNLEAAFKAFAPDSTPAPVLQLITPPQPQKAADAEGEFPPPSAPPASPVSTILMWLALVVALAGLCLAAFWVSGRGG
jgi:serine/threonine-protein kinase